ncbi:PTS sugar transporter [Clostridium paraputrificum]|uniref:Mannose permease IIC component n=1 Tax=Clostridium paraputrificum TaxID=29363 RepID=A0A6N3GQW5_9CLOT
MLTSAIIITIIAIIATIDYNGPLLMLHRPLVTGALTGLALGDFTQGLIIGATLELMWLGVTGIGGYTPPDTISGAIIGTAFGILSGQGATAGIAIAVPVAVVTQQLDVIAKTVDIFFVKKAEKAASRGDMSKIDLYHYLCLLVIVLFKIIPIFVAILVGGEYIKDLFDKIPPIIMTGLNVAGGMLPAIGFGMLLNMMLKKKMWVFLLVGFICSAFGGMSTIGISLVGVAAAYLFTNNITPAEPKVVTEVASNTIEEEEYDL